MVALQSAETPDFIRPLDWPLNSPDPNPVDYAIWGILQERVYRCQIYCDVHHLKERLIEEWLSGVVLVRALLTEQWISGVIDCIKCVRGKGGHFEHLIWTFWLFWLTSTALETHDLWVVLLKNKYFSKARRIFMKLHSNVCNRCRLVCAKFYLNWISFAVVTAKCLGGSLLGHTVYYRKISIHT